MIDIDLGPAIGYLIIIFCIVPGIIGFLVGFLGVIFISKRRRSKSKNIILALVCGGVCAILFPVMFITVEGWVQNYEKNRLFMDTLAYEKELPDYYAVKRVGVVDGNYQIAVSALKSGSYVVVGRAYQGGVCRGLFSKKLVLDSGEDRVISGFLNDVQYDNYDACKVLYKQLPAVSVGKIDSSKSIDFVVEFFNKSAEVPTLINNSRAIAVTNAKMPIKDGSIIFYSPDLSGDGTCPVYNHGRLSVCVPNSALRYNSTEDK